MMICYDDMLGIDSKASSMTGNGQLLLSSPVSLCAVFFIKSNPWQAHAILEKTVDCTQHLTFRVTEDWTIYAEMKLNQILK